MTILDSKCFSKKIHKLAEKRMFQKNTSKKEKKDKIKFQPDKYLTQEELYNLNCVSHNDIYDKIMRKINLNPGKSKAPAEILEFMKTHKSCVLSCLGRKNIRSNYSNLVKDKYSK